MCLTALVLKQIRPNPRFLSAFNVLLGMVFLTGAVVAFYHVGVEWGVWPAPSGCAAGAVDLTAIDLSDLDQRQATSSCTEIPWSFLGLSMAAWNGLISLALAATSFGGAILLRRL
jgi:disulfide bond formation protein DsbB